VFFAIAFSPLLDWIGLACVELVLPAFALACFALLVFFFAAIVHSPLSNRLGKI
jgi:hypothetical protein